MSEADYIVIHPLLIIDDWRKGCSCPLDSSTREHDHPSECRECTDAAIKEIESWFKQNPQWNPKKRSIDEEPEHIK